MSKMIDYNFFTCYGDSVCICPLCTKDRALADCQGELATEKAKVQKLKNMLIHISNKNTKGKDLYQHLHHICDYRVALEAQISSAKELIKEIEEV